MSAKANAQDPHDSFFQWATNARLNADVIAEMSMEGLPIYAIRLRPWKQDKRFPKMFIGAGDSLLYAMKAAVAVYHTGEEQALDYAFRPWRAVALANTPLTWEAPF